MNNKRLNQKKCLKQIQFANSQPNFERKFITKKTFSIYILKHLKD